MTNNIPFFSIIIPVYNTEKELPRCVDSILEQSFQDYEIILVDDGSKDGSAALCDKYASADDRVKCIHKPNGGCSEARNTGVHMAQGKYLIFVDSDDMWDSVSALQHVYTKLDEDSFPEVICFGVAIYDENGNLVKKRQPDNFESTCIDKLDRISTLVYKNEYISTSYVKALDREYFFRNSLFFKKNLLSEDIEWSARILLSCKNISVLSETFYKRIQRSTGSITSSIGEKNILDILGSIENGVLLAKSNAENEHYLSVYYEYWAYQYAMLLGLAYRLKENRCYSNIVGRLNNLRWLLNYDNVRKVKYIHYTQKIIGLKATMWLADKYYRSKSN